VIRKVVNVEGNVEEMWKYCRKECSMVVKCRSYVQRDLTSTHFLENVKGGFEIHPEHRIFIVLRPHAMERNTQTPFPINSLQHILHL
jgi:hypothetical protein